MRASGLTLLRLFVGTQLRKHWEALPEEQRETLHDELGEVLDDFLSEYNALTPLQVSLPTDKFYSNMPCWWRPRKRGQAHVWWAGSVCRGMECAGSPAAAPGARACQIHSKPQMLRPKPKT